ncbi:hypothetical protein HDU89_001377 [Geranomyces variabilis]|nr:hypothetical protein HDU89_001377 [Geranomyces variabilis]
MFKLITVLAVSCASLVLAAPVSDKVGVPQISPATKAAGAAPAGLPISTAAHFSPTININECLAAHNNARAQDGRRALSWSTNLQSAAQQWADTEAAGGGAEHHSGVYGENLYQEWGFTSNNAAPTCADAVAMWIAEKPNFPVGGRIGDGNFGSYGHYTQIIWGTTTQVGCGIAVRQDATLNAYIVCRYDPPGNYWGQQVPN